MIEKTLFTEEGFLTALVDDLNKRVDSKICFENGFPLGIELDSKEIIEGIFNLIFNSCTEYAHGGHRVVVKPQKLFDNIVIKIEKSPYSNYNLTEWENWCLINSQFREMKEYFVPLRYLSQNRKILIQYRVDKVITCPEDLDNLPEDVKKKGIPPSWILSDCHYENFGVLNNRLVCIDYDYSDVLLYIREANVDFRLFYDILNADNHEISDSIYDEVLDILNRRKKRGLS